MNTNKDTQKEIKKLLKEIESKVSEELEKQLSSSLITESVKLDNWTGYQLSLYCYMFFNSNFIKNQYILLKRNFMLKEMEGKTKISSNTLRKYFNELTKNHILIKDDNGFIVKELKEITKFLKKDECQDLTKEELYAYWKIKIGKEYSIDKFYFKELYWKEVRRDYQSNRVRNTLDSLQRKSLIKWSALKTNGVLIYLV